MDKDKKTPAEDPDITYTVKGDTFAGGWETPTQSYQVSYDGGGTVDTVDINDMMRADAGKGMENMTCLLYTSPSPRDS